MTEKDLLNALSDMEEGYIEHAAAALEGRGAYGKRKRMRKFIALAAAICLVVTGVICQRIIFSLPLLAASSHPEQITGTQGWIEGDHRSNAPASLATPGNVYSYAIAVSARVTEVLPDLYQIPGRAEEYHILHLQVNDVIAGKNVPEEVYYLLAADLSPDLTEYTDIVFALEQISCENGIMLNTTKGRVETFDFLFDSYAYPTYSQAEGYIVPFSNGILDTGLWEKEGWKEVGLKHLPASPSDSLLYFPAYRGCTLEETKEMIRQKAYGVSGSRDDGTRTVSKLSDFTSDAAQNVLEYVKPFENGVFYQNQQNGPWQSYTRLINGFLTDEVITLNSKTGAVTYSGDTYTEEHLQNVPDISALIQKLQEKEPMPPHLWVTKDMTRNYYQIKGRYALVNDRVYGIVSVKWQYRDEQFDYHDDELYYLVSPDGSYRRINKLALQIFTGERL
jgi:hypothetical protein